MSDILTPILEADRQAMVALNIPDLHTEALDSFFYSVSGIFVWAPLLALILFVTYRCKDRRIWAVVLFIALCFLLADRITSGLMKPYFAKLRPSHDPLVMDQLRYAFGYLGGKYGFPSSHAANSFAFATFMSLVFGNRISSCVLVSWAALCSYSRLYLGVHFPTDICVGTLVGIAIGLCCYLGYRWFAHRPTFDKCRDRDLSNREAMWLSCGLMLQLVVFATKGIALY